MCCCGGCRYEAEFFQQQMLLESDKATALAQARALQDEVTRLQERLAQMLAKSGDADALDGLNKSVTGLKGEHGWPLRRAAVNSCVACRDRGAAAATGVGGRDGPVLPALVPAVQGDMAQRLKAHLAAANAGDRDMMLKQIDALRAAREEAEHLRQESKRLQDELSAQVRDVGFCSLRVHDF